MTGDTSSKSRKKNLSRIHPETILKEYSDPGSSVHKEKIKHISTDYYKDGMQKIKEIFEDDRQLTLLSNAASGEEPLSLFANLNNDSRRVQMVVADRNTRNLENTIFKTLLAGVSDDRQEFVELLTGQNSEDVLALPKEEIERVLTSSNQNEYMEARRGDWESIAEYDDNDRLLNKAEVEEIKTEIKKDWKDRKVKVKKFEKDFPITYFGEVPIAEYFAEEHYEKLLEKAEGIQNKRLRQMFFSGADTLTSYLSNPKKYAMFIDGFLKSLKRNNGSNYMANDEIFKNLSSFLTLDGNNVFSKIHFMNNDLSKKSGIESLDSLLKERGHWKNGKRNIDLAYLPHINEAKNFVTYLRDNARYIISTTPPTLKGRGWKLDPVTNLPVFNNKEFDKKKLKVPGFDFVEKSEKLEGLPPSKFMAGLNVGHIYSDTQAIMKNIAMANQEEIKRLYISGLLAGQFSFQQNDRRKLYEPGLESLNDKLKVSKKILDSFNGEVVLTPGDGETSVAIDLYNLYIWEKARRSGDTRIARTSMGGLLLDREAYDQVHDTTKEVIETELIPYMIRLGYDPTEVDDKENKIIELIDSLERYRRLEKEGKLEELLDEDKDLLDLDLLSGDQKIKYSHEFVDNFNSHNGENLGIRVMQNTMFSDVTQYVNGLVGLLTKSDLAANGADKNLKEQIYVDGRQAKMWLKATNGHLLMSNAHMIDDSKYNDPNLIPHKKRVKSDPVHKRQTISKNPNLPGTWDFAGDQRYRAIITPNFPKVIENMEYVQKTGSPYEGISVANIQDIQTGSLTEDLRMVTLFNDYAFHQAGCKGAVFNGDVLQGRNYPDMPNENRVLGGVTLDDQSLTAAKLFSPFIPYLDFCDITPGNHEWNTDKFYQGINFLNELRGAINMYNQLNPNSPIDFQMSNYAYVDENGKMQLMKTNYVARTLGGFNNLFGHKWSERGAGKGSSKIPSTHIASWGRQMGELARPFEILNGAHYHGLEIICQDNKLGIIQPSFAEESGFEYSRQYSGNRQMGLISHYRPDGKASFEIVTAAFLEDYYKTKGIQNPTIKAMGGLDRYMEHVISMEANNLTGKNDLPEKQMYRRTITPGKSR